jgi:hypothetical protein
MIWDIIKNVAAARKSFPLDFNPAEHAQLFIKANHIVEVQAKALKPGDCLQSFDGKFSTSMVESIDESLVYLVRPYLFIESVLKTGVHHRTCYERYSLILDSNTTYNLLEPTRERIAELKAQGHIK